MMEQWIKSSKLEDQMLPLVIRRLLMIYKYDRISVYRIVDLKAQIRSLEVCQVLDLVQ